MTKKIEMKDFETKRLILKKVTELDIASYQKNIADYEVIRFLSSKVPWPYPDDGAKIFLNNFVFPRLEIDRWFWGIFLKENPEELVGAVDLWLEPCPENRGFWLAKKYWGKGIMSEAIKPITEYAFTHLGFEKLILSNAVGNHASSRIKEKFGAKLLGVRKAEFATGEFYEAQTWELTRDDWFKHNRPSFIGNYRDLQDKDNATYAGDDELLSIGSPVGKLLGLKKIGIHIETLPSGRRTSWPHAESEEEEFAYVIKGSPQVWINGYVYDLVEGDFVAFSAGTGIAHTFLNNSDSEVLLLVGGDRSIVTNKVYYPLHSKRNEEMKQKGVLWEDYPTQYLGTHNGEPKMKVE